MSQVAICAFCGKSIPSARPEGSLPPPPRNFGVVHFFLADAPDGGTGGSVCRQKRVRELLSIKRLIDKLGNCLFNLNRIHENLLYECYPPPQLWGGGSSIV